MNYKDYGYGLKELEGVIIVLLDEVFFIALIAWRRVGCRDGL